MSSLENHNETFKDCWKLCKNQGKTDEHPFRCDAVNELFSISLNQSMPYLSDVILW